jgi:hypothetical protein
MLTIVWVLVALVSLYVLAALVHYVVSHDKVIERKLSREPTTPPAAQLARDDGAPRLVTPAAANRTADIGLVRLEADRNPRNGGS